MQRLRMAMVAGASLLVLSAGAGAQLRTVINGGIPAGYTPPAGLCRVWYDGVAPGRQPAPTDCATARANVRAGGRVIYGPTVRGGTYDPRYDHRGQGQGGWNDGRDGRDDDRWDRERAKRQRELEKERRKREHEREKAWKKAHKRDRHHDRDRDDDDRWERGRRDDDGTYGRTGTTTGRPSWPQGDRTTTTQPGRTPCVDANHDGVCDGGILGRVRVP